MMPQKGIRRNRSMHIGSGLNTVSSLYGQQKGNQMKTPASAEKDILYG